MVIGAVGCCLAIGGLPFVVAAPVAAEQILTVTTTDDVVDPDDGLLSLREAVDLANASTEATTIVLSPATYELTICTTDDEDEDDNASGDLDVTGDHDLTIDGNGATITQTCANARHLHHQPTSNTPLLTLEHLTLTGTHGVVDHGISILTASSLTLESVTMDRNNQIEELDPHDPPPLPDGAAAIVATGDGSLTIIDSQIVDTLAAAAIRDEQTGGTHSISGTTIARNGASGVAVSSDYASAISVLHRDLEITDSTIEDNYVLHAPGEVTGAVHAPDDPDHPEPLTDYGALLVNGTAWIERTSIERNAGNQGGAVTASRVTLIDSRVEENVAGFTGGGILAGYVTIIGSAIARNSGAAGPGGIGLCSCMSAVSLPPTPSTVEASTITGNVSHQGAGVLVWEDTELTIYRSTITGNTSYAGAGLDLRLSEATTTVLESTIAGNTPPSWQGDVFGDAAPPPHDVLAGTGAQLSVRLTVLGDDSGLAACNTGGTLASGGHNFDADGSCGLAEASDISDGGDPLLGVLGDHGGPTQTRVPLPGSPLLGHIPPATPGCAGAEDQRGVSRPQGAACDIGAVEVDETAIVVTTTDDVVDPDDGLLSLREAIDLANASTEATTIVLSPATYELTICTPDDEEEDDNASGDLDITGDHDLTIAGNGATIVQTCEWIGTFHAQPLLAYATVRFENLVFDGVSQAVEQGSIVTNGASHSLNPHETNDRLMTFDSVHFTDNWASRPVTSTGPIHVDDMEISGNLLLEHGFWVSNTLQVTNLSFTDNELGGDAIAIQSDAGLLEVSDSEFARNGPPGLELPLADLEEVEELDPWDFPLSPGIAGGPALIHNTRFADNVGIWGPVIGNVTLNGSTITGNIALEVLVAGQVDIDHSVVSSNVVLEFGLAFFVGGRIANSTVSNNLGLDYGGQRSNAAVAARPGDELSIERSTITGNEGAGSGGLVMLGDGNLTLHEVTTAGNSGSGTSHHPHPGGPQIPAAAEIAAASNATGTLMIRNSVLGDGNSSTSVCNLGDVVTVISEGHNFDADGSCGLTEVSDISGGGDPQLGTLGDHGGPTLTRVPLPGSPLLGHIPAATPGCAGTEDQRGVARPQGPACDIGAVEVDETAIVVTTTTDDVVDPDDGLLSLREAVDLANASSEATTIVLSPATYELTICTPDDEEEDDNASGDLDVTGDHDLTIAGNGATIVQTCPNARHLHQQPGTGSTLLTVQHATLTGAHDVEDEMLIAGCAVYTTTDLALDHTTITANSHCYATVFSEGDNETTLTDSDISHNSTEMVIYSEGWFGIDGTVTLDGTTIAHNTHLAGWECSVVCGREVIVVDSEILDNPSGDPLPDTMPIIENPYSFHIEGDVAIYGIETVLVERSTIEGNSGIYGAASGGEVTVRDSLIHRNAGHCGSVSADSLLIERSTFSGNFTGACGAITVGAGYSPSDGSVDQTTLTNNHGNGAILVFGGDLELRRSTITDNPGWGGGGGLWILDGTATVRSSTIAGNRPASDDADPDYLAEVLIDDGTLTVSSTVLGEADSDMAACSTAVHGTGQVISEGHNFDADGSCGLTEASDISDGGDPQLGTLGDNGGPTHTRVPLPGSPLLGHIPAATPGCAGTEDQRGVARPQGPGCDIGAVEVDETAIVVTTTDDVVDPHDGLLSLREAVDLANTADEATTITLEPDTYELTICTPGDADEDANTSGDLDITGDYDVTIDGNGATIDQTCANARHLHHQPGVAAATLAVEEVTLTGAHEVVDDGISILAVGSLSLHGVLVADNSGSPDAFNGDHDFDSSAAIVTTGTGMLELVGTSIIGTAHGAGLRDAQTGGTATISDSEVSGNDGSPFFGGISAFVRPLAVTDTTIEDNRRREIPAELHDVEDLCESDAPHQFGGIVGVELDLARVIVSGSVGCAGGGIWALELDLEDSIVEGNAAFFGGGVKAGHATISSTIIRDNLAVVGGGAKVIDGTIGATTVRSNLAVLGGGLMLGDLDGSLGFGDAPVVEASTISGNLAYDGAGIYVENVVATIDRSTITANGGSHGTGLFVNDGVAIVHETTLSGNADDDLFAPHDETPSEIDGHGDAAIEVRNTVLGSPGLTTCDLDDLTVVSEGHNFASDGSCGLTEASDVSDGGDPMLGELGDNGGPTETRVPLEGSPLLGHIPAVTSGCAGAVDQRGVARPQGAACEVGAVEVDEGSPPLPSGVLITAGGPGWDEVRHLVDIGSGDVVAVGKFEGTISAEGAELVSGGASDGFVIRVGEDGTPAWATQVSSVAVDEVWEVTVDVDGHPVIAGIFSDGATLGGEVLTAEGSTDALVAKLHADTGEVLWVRRFGGAGEDKALGIATRPGGGVAVTGWTGAGTVTFSDTDSTMESPGPLAGLVALFDTDGALDWVEPIGAPNGLTYPKSVAVSSNGTVAVAGYFVGATTFGTAGPSRTADLLDAFIATFEPDGGPATRIDHATTGGTSLAVWWDIEFITPTIVATAGLFGDQLTMGTATVASAGGADGAVAAFDLEGPAEPVIYFAVSGPGNEAAFSLHSSDAGLTIAGGFTADADLSGIPLNGGTGFNTWIGHIGPTGTWVRVAQTTNDGSVLPLGTVTTPTNTTWHAGIRQGTNTFGTPPDTQTTPPAAGNNDLYITNL